MMKSFLGPAGLWDKGFAIVRIVTGMFLIFHGTQAFNAEDMKGYAQWLTDLHFPAPAFMAYAGKACELLGGVCLLLGLFTKLASIFLFVTFCTITFGMGHGKIFTEDQHPFMFAMISLIFLFAGPGPWSLDKRFFGPPAD